jgi:hypothetical protein
MKDDIAIAELEVLNDWRDELDLKLFNIALKKMREMGRMTENKINEFINDFEVYISTRHKIAKAKKHKFKLQMVYDALPNNQWVYFLTNFFNRLSEGNDTHIELNEVDRIDFIDDVERKLKGLDKH